MQEGVKNSFFPCQRLKSHKIPPENYLGGGAKKVVKKFKAALSLGGKHAKV